MKRRVPPRLRAERQDEGAARPLPVSVSGTRLSPLAIWFSLDLVRHCETTCFVGVMDIRFWVGNGDWRMPLSVAAPVVVV
jgi:hypothetical protein